MNFEAYITIVLAALVALWGLKIISLKRLLKIVIVIVSITAILISSIKYWKNFFPSASDGENGTAGTSQKRSEEKMVNMVNVDEELPWSPWQPEMPPSEIYEQAEVESGQQSRYREISFSEEYSEWGKWSPWRKDIIYEDELTEVESKQQYRYRDMETVETTEYSGWSPWQNNYIEEREDREIKTRTVVTGTQYLMGHYCENTGNHFTSYTNNTDNSVFNKKCFYHELGWFSDLSQFRKKSPNASSYWDYESGDTTYAYYPDGSSMYRCSSTCYIFYILDTEDVKETQYRYRTVTTSYDYYWGEWSDWSDNAVEERSSREIETRTMYRSRSREIISKVEYGEWSDWYFDLPDDYFNSDDYETETRTV